MGLLMVGSIINYLTRSTLAVAAPTLLKDLDIGTQQYSWVLSAFQFAIMLQPLWPKAAPAGGMPSPWRGREPRGPYELHPDVHVLSARDHPDLALQRGGPRRSR
jgi:MFS family permease